MKSLGPQTYSWTLGSGRASRAAASSLQGRRRNATATGTPRSGHRFRPERRHVHTSAHSQPPSPAMAEANIRHPWQRKSKNPQCIPALGIFLFGVADGARTHDNRNHNPGLYQLSYSHRRSIELYARNRQPNDLRAATAVLPCALHDQISPEDAASSPSVRLPQAKRPACLIWRLRASPARTAAESKNPQCISALGIFLFGVADGARTHDNRNHNPGLYQLSYSHRRRMLLYVNKLLDF